MIGTKLETSKMFFYYVIPSTSASSSAIFERLSLAPAQSKQSVPYA